MLDFQVDEVSSVGGLTSVATRMEHERKQGLVLADGRISADSFGWVGGLTVFFFSSSRNKHANVAAELKVRILVPGALRWYD